MIDYNSKIYKVIKYGANLTNKIPYSGKIVRNFYYEAVIPYVKALLGKLGIYDKIKLGKLDTMKLGTMDKKVSLEDVRKR